MGGDRREGDENEALVHVGTNNVEREGTTIGQNTKADAS